MTRDEKFKMLVEAGAFDQAMELQRDSDRAVLARKLSEVYAEVHGVEKTGRNDYHGYDYVEEAEVARRIRAALGERGVYVAPAAHDLTREENVTTAHMSYLFVDGETGATIERPWFGQGADKQDKGAYKAYTGSLKYFLLKAFQVPTGDDPERPEYDRQRQKQQAPNPKQRVKQLVAGCLTDEQRKGIWGAMATHFGVDSWKSASDKTFTKIADAIAEYPHSDEDDDTSPRARFLLGMGEEAA